MNIKASLRVKLLAAFVIVLVVSSTVAGFGYKTQNDRTETIGWIDHTNEVLTAADNVLIGLINMETGFRGYMTTGDDGFLEPYNVGEMQVSETLAELKELTSDNPAQVDRWNTIEGEWQGWIAEWIEPGFAIRQEANMSTESISHLDGTIAEGRGKAAMDELRGVLDQLEIEMIRNDNDHGAHLVAQITEDIVNQETGMRGFIVTGEEDFLDPYIGGQADWTSHMATLQPSLASHSAQDLAARADALASQWRQDAAEPWIAGRRAVNENPTTVEDVAAYVNSGGGKQFMDAMRADLSEAREVEQVLPVERQESDATAASLSSNVTIFGSLIAIAIGLTIAFLLSRSISNAVSVIAKAAEGIAIGDLDQQVQVDSRDELGEMASTFRKMMRYLKSMAEGASSLAQGDLSTEVTAKSAKDELGTAFSRMIDYLREMAAAATLLAGGDLSADVEAQSEQDVLGVAFSEMIAYQNEMAAAATLLANGDLSADVTPKSEDDALGNAFDRMIVSWRTVIGQVKGNATDVSNASDGMARAAQQAGMATTQIAGTIQQVASGNARQSDSVSTTLMSVKQMASTIEGVARGAQEQTRSIGETSKSMNELSVAVEEIRQGAELQAHGMSQAALAVCRRDKYFYNMNSPTGQNEQLIATKQA